jgi:protein-L-isoaspartate(D-aspartate) O-methyltransferase
VELQPSLFEMVQQRLNGLGYSNIYFKLGDGHQGWDEHEPYDAILVAAASRTIPDELTAQLKPGGRMVIPIGAPAAIQSLILLKKDLSGVVNYEIVESVRFVPLLENSK